MDILFSMKCSSSLAKLFRLLGVIVWLTLMAFPAFPVHASQYCEAPNVIPRSMCDMDTFHGSPPREVPDGWTAFMLSGDAEYAPSNDTFADVPSLMMHSSGGTFKGGIYGQVKVTPGAGYRASIAWGAPNAPDTFGRQLGIDPTGGTDPNSPNIVWGPMHWGPGRMLNYPPPDVNIDVRARAANSTITVFFLVDHPRSTGDNLIFIDDLALFPDESAPAIQLPPTDTPTPVPARPAVVAQPPTATPTATDSPTPTDTPTATPTDTPPPTPSPTNTATSTSTPTWTPWPTATPASGKLSLDIAQTGLLDLARTSHPFGLILFSGLSFGGAGLCAVSLLWLRRRH